MNSNEFTRAARQEAWRRHPEPVDVATGEPVDDWGYEELGRKAVRDGAEWARTYLAQQEQEQEPGTADRVLAWAVQQYPSGTPLDQDRRMVAAETEAFLSGRTGRETSKLVLAAKYAGPVDPPVEYEPTDAEVTAAMTAYEGHPDRVSAWRAALSAARTVQRGEEKRDD